MLLPNHSPEPTAVRAVSSAIVSHVTNRLRLSFLRLTASNDLRIYAFIFALAVSLICGCATEHHIAGRGDVGQFILDRAISYGGNPTTTNGFPAITSQWSYYKSEDGGVVILMARRDYSSTEIFLSQAFAGQRQFGPKDGDDGFRIFECRLTSEGGGIQLTRHTVDSQVIIRPPSKKDLR